MLVMPRLYCEKHGKERERDVIAKWKLYRDEGESVLVVGGKLISGPWLCDRCNAPLPRRRKAILMASFTRYITESIYDYDFAYERRYFAMTGQESMAVYGAPWPGGDVTELLRRHLSGDLS